MFEAVSTSWQNDVAHDTSKISVWMRAYSEVVGVALGVADAVAVALCHSYAAPYARQVALARVDR